MVVSGILLELWRNATTKTAGAPHSSAPTRFKWWEMWWTGRCWPRPCERTMTGASACPNLVRTLPMVEPALNRRLHEGGKPATCAASTASASAVAVAVDRGFTAGRRAKPPTGPSTRRTALEYVPAVISRTLRRQGAGVVFHTPAICGRMQAPNLDRMARGRCTTARPAGRIGLRYWILLRPTLCMPQASMFPCSHACLCQFILVFLQIL